MHALKSKFQKFAVMICLSSFISWNAWAIDDSDLSGELQPYSQDQIPLELSPDRIETDSSTGPLVIEVLREDHGKLTPVPSLPIKLNLNSKQSTFHSNANGIIRLSQVMNSSVPVEISLKEKYFEITNSEQTYKIKADLPGAGKTRLIFNSDSSGGQALGIWQVAQRAKSKLKAEIGLDFWSTPISFVWPAQGDYYSSGSVHISRGDHWDVVGHELGHAIYDLGHIGLFGGGPHKIDECYSAELALSEGWASFFSAWTSVDLNDPDAKFEYMVPRRSPIQFENIPADVCKGETNEWRVTGFFWDLVDIHVDSETSEESFGRIWNVLKNSRVKSASEAKIKLVKAGFAPSILQGIWDLNFQK